MHTHLRFVSMLNTTPVPSGVDIERSTDQSRGANGLHDEMTHDVAMRIYTRIAPKYVR